MSFSFESPVYFDELDVNGHLHNARYALHVERAQTALFESVTTPAARIAERDADLYYVVRTLHVEFLAPFSTPGAMTVTLTADRIGTTSATYGFRCGAGPVHAEGHRVIVKVDPATGRPVPWSDWYRGVFEELGR